MHLSRQDASLKHQYDYILNRFFLTKKVAKLVETQKSLFRPLLVYVVIVFFVFPNPNTIPFDELGLTYSIKVFRFTDYQQNFYGISIFLNE